MPRQATSRQEVLTAARKALARGRRPTMDEFAAGARVSRATLYRLFGSQQTLLRELRVQPPPATRDRILEAALEELGRRGLRDLSMDELASAAGVSRATLYRLFPDKARLFRDLVRTYSPWEPLSATVQVMHDRPPQEVMPALARALVTARGVRAGMLGRMLLEVMRGGADTEAGAAYVLGGPLPVLARYLTDQMVAGRLRRMHPLVAFQAFVGPIVIHLMTRREAESRLGLKLSTDEVVTEFVQAWLRAMTPAEKKR